MSRFGCLPPTRRREPGGRRGRGDATCDSRTPRSRDSIPGPSRLGTGRAGFRLRLVDCEGDPRGIVEDREPTHAGNLRLRHEDRAAGRANLPERLVDVLREDVVEDARGQVLGLLEAATGRAWR